MRIFKHLFYTLAGSEVVAAATPSVPQLICGWESSKHSQPQGFVGCQSDGVPIHWIDGRS